MERYVIIGSGSGIGAEIARNLAGPEVELLLHTGSNSERLGGVAQTCREAGAKVSTCLGLTEDAALFDAVAQWAAPLADGALTGFVFAANLAPRGITVNAVVPGFIEKEPGTPSSLTPAQWQHVTASIPMSRIGRRVEVAAMVTFLLSEPAGYVTGQSIHVNGGLTL
jgi:NAD(P)-dependent dehydrogenase (short-subunit alcohol dehydrogenase family)